MNSGHYTSSVKRNRKWYLTNDQDIKEFRKFHSTSSDTLTHYLLIYQRSQLAECHAIQSHVENHQIADLHVKGHLEVLLEENQSINPMVKKDLSSYFSDQILKTSAQRKRNYRSKEPSKITKERKERAREYIKEKRSAESSLEKKERQQKDAAKTANRRKQESSLEKKERQQKNTTKTGNRRKQKSSLENKERQQKDAAKTANSRKQESSLEKKERQQKNTAKTANRRKQESSLEKKERQQKDAANTASKQEPPIANRRKQESSLEKKERQKKDLENKVKTRSCERDIGAQEPTFPPLITEEQTKSCLAKFIQATSNESLNVLNVLCVLSYPIYRSGYSAGRLFLGYHNRAGVLEYRQVKSARKAVAI